jgi:hypothetical protein
MRAPEKGRDFHIAYFSGALAHQQRRMETSMATQDIQFLLSARVNGEEFEMNGTGIGDSSQGTCELHLKADPCFPKGFDPVSCPLICSHPTSTFFARSLRGGPSFAEMAAHAYHVSPAREGVVRDFSGRELLRLQVTGHTFVDDRKRLVSKNVMSGTSTLPPIARNVTPLRDYIMPAGIGSATALVRYSLVTMQGEALDGLTVVPYQWEARTELESPLVRFVEDIQVEWNGRDTVSAYYRVAIAPLSIEATIDPIWKSPAERFQILQSRTD